MKGPSIAPEELRKRLESQADQIKLIDVREEWEYDENGLTSTHLSLYALSDHLDTIRSWGSKTIVFYCNTGARGNVGVKFLQQNGIQDVLNLEGGLVAYQAMMELQK